MIDGHDRARAHGLTIPQALAVRADLVIP